MHVLSLFSRKGGVGRTVFAVNLAAIFAEQGLRVAVLECDPQNTLSQHFDDLDAHTRGWAHTLLPDSHAEPVHWSPRDNLMIIPFGRIGSAQRLIVEQALAAQPQWLAEFIRAPFLANVDVMLIDTPGGYSVYSDQAERVASAALSIWLCDAASQKAFIGSERRVLPAASAHRHIINQINASKGSRRALMKRWRELVGDELLPAPVHQDELVSDALHEGTTVTWYAKYSQAAHDLQGVATWLRQEWLADV